LTLLAPDVILSFVAGAKSLCGKPQAKTNKKVFAKGLTMRKRGVILTLVAGAKALAMEGPTKNFPKRFSKPLDNEQNFLIY